MTCRTHRVVELGFPLGLELASGGVASAMQGIACDSQRLRRRKKRGWGEEP